MDVHKTWRDIANFKLKVLKNEITLLKEAVRLLLHLFSLQQKAF